MIGKTVSHYRVIEQIGAGGDGDSSQPSRVRRGKKVIFAIGGLALVSFVILQVSLRLFQRSGKAIDSIAVLPFVNMSGNTDTDYLTDGLTESLIDSLSELPNLKVMSNSSVSRYKGKTIDPKIVGRELGVRAVLIGRVTQHGDSLLVGAELVNVEDDSAFWGEQYNRKLSDALVVQNDIAARISEKLRLKLSNEQKTRLAKRQTDNPEAYQLYLKGRYHAAKFSNDEMATGFDYFNRAIALDPNYALAYAGIAYYYNLADDWMLAPGDAMPKAKEAARKAVELDDTLAEAHVELGSAYLFYDFDWAGAEHELQRAVNLSPNYAPAHEYYAWYMLSVGRVDESLMQTRTAEQLDPSSAEIRSLAGWFLYYAHRYDEAIAELRKCLDVDADYWNCHYYIGQVYQQRARPADAITELQTAAKILEPQNAGPEAELAHAYAISGRQTEARRILNELLDRSRRSRVSKYNLATLYAALGDKNEALSQLEQAYAERSFLFDFMNVDPELDSLRSEPRFQELRRRLNFPR